MATWSCPVCGEPADENEIDPHGHFSGDELLCGICGETKQHHELMGDAEDHEYEEGDEYA